MGPADPPEGGRGHRWLPLASERAVIKVLSAGRDHGFLGPGPIEAHLVHAHGFARACGDPPSGRCLDLGSGAGIPGLPLALAWPGTRWTLVEAGGRRADLLGEAVVSLDLADRVEVALGRAELLAREPGLRARFALVTARGFGPPAVTAECAAGFLAVGGRLVVSEPPTSSDRWPTEGLARLGMHSTGLAGEGPRFQVVEQGAPCPQRYPRRVGIPAKRPLF